MSNLGVTSKVHTFILAGGEGRRLYPLTRHRAKPVVPLAGDHRLIDFTLSNCFNSGLRRIHILTQYQCESLHSYIRALTFRRPFANGPDRSLLCMCPISGKRYRGTADAVFQNLAVLENTTAEFVVILSSDHVYRMDYRELLRFHVDHGGEVTVAGVECPLQSASQFGVLEADSAQCIQGFEEKPGRPKGMTQKPAKALVNMGVYVFNRNLLIQVLSEDAQRNTSHDFGRDIFPGLIGRACVYNFTEEGTRLGSYWRDVGTLESFYRVNMELMLNERYFDPYLGADWPLYSLALNCDPRSYRVDRRSETVKMDSMIPQGVSISPDSEVRHSVLSPGVRVEPSAKVDDSILLHNVRVGSGVRIRRAIIDEGAYIGDDVEIGYNAGSDREYGLVTENGITVVPANTHVGLPQTRQASGERSLECRKVEALGFSSTVRL